MSLKPRKTCSVLSFDYLDYDVYLNIIAFYRGAGFHVTRNFDGSSSDLVVVLRGWPPQVYDQYTGALHVYDYVKELSIDYLTFFPQASHLFYISITPNASLDFSSGSKYTYINGYLPVIPEIWTSSSVKKTHTQPLHIANYKPMPEDTYQEQLISLSKQKKLMIYGRKWHMVGITSSSLSYWAANRLLAGASHCYGLMYPYQRGQSLSGRMWQAPINGCVVLSELGTNIFDCPGVVETDNFSLPAPELPLPSFVSSRAISFWKKKSDLLAQDLGLSFLDATDRWIVQDLRLMLFWHHVVFLWNNSFMSRLLQVRLLITSSLRRFFSSF